MKFSGKHLLTQALIQPLLVLLCVLQAAMAEDLPSEQSVRAAMVFNFLKFIDYPPGGNDDSRTRLCISVRDTRQAEALVALSGLRVKGRNLIVEYFSAKSSDCDVFYVDSRPRWNAASEHPALRQALTVSTYPGFTRDGGMIEIAVRDEGAQFDINLVEGRRAGFHFAPEMLRLARRIHE